MSLYFPVLFLLQKVSFYLSITEINLKEAKNSALRFNNTFLLRFQSVERYTSESDVKISSSKKTNFFEAIDIIDMCLLKASSIRSIESRLLTAEIKNS